MFYDDAKRHMSRKMKQNIENFETSLNACNIYIHASNVTIDNRIKEIVARPVYTKLTNEQVSSIYTILKIGFSQVIRSGIDIPTAIKNWNFSAKLKSYGFNAQDEVNNANNILGAIQQDQIILDHVTKARNNMVGLQNQQDVIKKQSKEISSRIASHRYRARHRCCPSLIKELWHSFF